MDTVSQVIIPTVTETGARGERVFDIYSLLLRERIVFLGTPINDQIANLIIAQLLYLEREDPEKDISLYIHCPGGIISAGLAIYDTMQLLRCSVSTICVGPSIPVRRWRRLLTIPIETFTLTPSKRWNMA